MLCEIGMNQHPMKNKFAEPCKKSQFLKFSTYFTLTNGYEIQSLCQESKRLEFRFCFISSAFFQLSAVEKEVIYLGMMFLT